MVLNLFNFNRDKRYQPSEHIFNYTVENIMGEGRFGICYQVSHGGKMYILKQLKRGMLNKTGVKARFEEEILMNLRHESIPRFIKKIACEDFNGYVLEFKDGKTFEDVLYLERHEFNKDEIFCVGSQLIEILKYLHSKGVVHRDIRVPNMLYDGQKINLVDFGLARRINNKRYRADLDFAFLGDFLLHLYYSSFEFNGGKKGPWYEELELSEKELLFLKKLMGIAPRYKSILEVEHEFHETFDAI